MCRVLIIEDEYSVMDSIKEALEFKNYKTVSAENGLQALEACKDNLPDLIISDIMMPYMDGYEVLRAFQGNAATSLIPFIFLSGKTGSDEFRKAMNAGADDFLTKPFKIKDLLEKVEMRLKKKRTIEQLLNEFRTRMTRDLSHKFKIPLVSVIGYSDILQKELQKVNENNLLNMLTIIKSPGHRLNKIIEKFITICELSIPATRKMHPETVEFSTALLNSCLESAIAYFGRNENIFINVANCIIKISEYHLKKLIEELIDNAMTFSSPGSRIEIIGVSRAHSYTLEIKDYGRGFSKEELASFRGPGYSGNGLGLLIVNKIIHLYKGTLKIHSQKKMFTQITITLPASNREVI